MHPETAIQSIAVSQGGVATRAQALDAGFSNAQITRRIASHRWTRVSSGSYRIIDMPGRENLLRAAVAILPNAVASHYSAAALHRIHHVDTRVVSVAVHTQTTHTFPGVRVYRSHDRLPEHVITVDSLRITSAARTVVDLAAVVHPKQLSRIVDDAVASGKAAIHEIDTVLSQVARRGKPGVKAMRDVLARWIGESDDESPLERAGNRLLTDAGIEGWKTEYAIPWSMNRRFDVAFPDAELAIEWDSRRWHLQGEALESDRMRDAKAIAKGWRILRFTWADVQNRRSFVVDTVLAALAQSS